MSHVRPMTEVISAYDQWARTYETVENATRDLAAAVLRQYPLPMHDRDVLETGCGTGLNTTYLAQQSQSVLAVDGSAGMLAQARTRVTAPQVQWVQCDLSNRSGRSPRRVTLLGEELVAFRDGRGAMGLLELHCPHRGTSLEFGLLSERGIRCCYHGWLFDVDGTILETPGEPETSTLKDRLCHGAYPTHEYNGILFAYLGPPAQQPPFPQYDSFIRPGYRLIPGRQYFYPCNWLQILENAMDPVHTAFLHTIVTGAQFTEEFGKVPELDFIETPIGMLYIATRRVGANIWARMVEIILPNLQQVAPAWEDGHQVHPFDGPMMSRWIVPQDDTHTMFIEFRHVSETDGVTPSWWADRSVMLPGQLPESDSYEASQRRPGDYEAQVSQRPIAIHGLEHLGATDRGVLIFRQQLRRGIRAVQAGADPEGLCRTAGSLIPTYCNDTVVQVPAAPTPEEDCPLMRTTGRTLVESYLAQPPLCTGSAQV